MDAREAISKYLNETWTDAERQQIENYGQQIGAEMYGKLILSDSEEAELPEEDVFYDIVFGPETAHGNLILGALNEAADLHDEPGAIREEAEWRYLSQYFDNAEKMGTQKFHLYDGNTRIQLISRPSNDGDRTSEGQKTVEIGLEDVGMDDISNLPNLDYDASVNIAVDAPDSISVDMDDQEDIDNLVDGALEEANKQTEVSGQLSFRGEFDGGFIEVGGRRNRIVLDEYERGENPEADEILEIV